MLNLYISLQNKKKEYLCNYWLWNISKYICLFINFHQSSSCLVSCCV